MSNRVTRRVFYFNLPRVVRKLSVDLVQAAGKITIESRNPREVCCGRYIYTQPPAGLLVYSQRDHKKFIVDFLTQTTCNPREVYI